MKYWYQRPHAQLEAYIRTVLVVEGFSADDPNALPLVTTGMSLFMCRMQSSNKEHPTIELLFGNTVPAESWDIDPDTIIVAWFFKPFSLACIFDVAAKDLKAPITLPLWNAHKANALITQLHFAPTTNQRIEILAHFLTEQVAQNKKICENVKYATDQIMFNASAEILHTLINSLHMNERTFQRMFKKYVGITASYYRRICQFQLSFTQLRTKDFTSLSDVAFDNGFADQSHFIRSFKSFSKTTPQAYLNSGLTKKK